MDDSLLITIALTYVIGLPVAVIVLWVSVVRLKAKVARLEQLSPEARPAPETLPQAQAEVEAEIIAPSAPKPEPVADPHVETTVEAAPPAPARQSYVPPKAFVLRADKAAALGTWLSTNWIYLVAAVSLAAAGIFLVQYGIENGWLSPVARVVAALVFGAALVAAGEVMRRRWGDEGASDTAFLPSVFSGAGIVTLFAAILAGEHLYALIGPMVSLAGLVVVATGAVVLGWFSGPLLAGLGVAGAFAAPFVVGGESDVAELFYAYFALIVAVGLAIDAVRRWAWVSVLTLVMAYGAAWMLHAGLDKPEYYIAYLGALVPLAIAVPVLRLVPEHDGAGLADLFRPGLPLGWPGFPARLAAGAMLASAGLIGWAANAAVDAATFWLACAVELALFVAIALWARAARALEDLALAPVAVFLALPLMQATWNSGAYAAFRAFAQAEPGTPVPMAAWTLAAMAAAVGLVAAWRSLRPGRWPLAWAAGAALVGPMMLLGLELRWMPADILGAWPWAVTAAAMAGLMAMMAGVFARAGEGESDRLPVALATLSSLTMIAFAMVLVLSETALTLALAVTALVAAWLDRRFDLRPLGWFVSAGALVAGFRLIVWPGIDWANHAPYWELALAYGGTIALLVATLPLVRAQQRRVALVTGESAAWSLAAVFVSVLLVRMIEDVTGAANFDSHWTLSLVGQVWLVSAAVQLWRLQLGGWLRVLRLVLASVYGLVGLVFLAGALSWANPLDSSYELVLGVSVINTLTVAYGLPALLFALVARRFVHLPRTARLGALVAASGLGAFWLGVTIRHVWRGPDIALPGVTQYELYSYTIAMLVIGAGLLWQAIAKGSVALRRVAMTLIALTVAKVFLIDASGLTGLTRVASFLALGLSLAGLAFLNRWAAGRVRDDDDQDG